MIFKIYFHLKIRNTVANHFYCVRLRLIIQFLRNLIRHFMLYFFQGVLIVNKKYPVPKSYAPGMNPKVLQAFDRLKAGFEEAKETNPELQGRPLWLQSGFRSYELQKTLYDNYCNRDGKEEADRYSARPGHSEHQTGLCFDLNDITSEFGELPEGKWVAKNAHKYGFIIRYPEGKENITGYMYEPWHLRYLGVEMATDVYNSGLCLEEYLGIESYYINN